MKASRHCAVKATVGTTTAYVGNYFEWTGSTSTMKKYYYAGATRVAMRTGSSTINFLLGDHSLTKVRDRLGSQAITTNSSGVKSAEVRYYPWGNTRFTSGTTPTTYKFTGQRKEDYIKLYWYGSRWYDSYLNRWIQPDVIIPSDGNTNSQLIMDYHETRFLDQLNQENRNKSNDAQTKFPDVPTNPQAFDRYSYANNNPLNYTDPSGHGRI